MEFVDYNGNDITDLIIQPKENILFNADFKNAIINQKGQTTYSFSKITVTADGWITYGPNVDCTLSDSIRFVNRQTELRSIRQPIMGCKSGYYTIMVNVKSVSGSVYVDLNSNTTTTNKLVQGVNIYTINKTSDLEYFSINLAVNADISIYEMKLEIGTEYTGMPVFDSAKELLRCYRYQYHLGIGWANQYPARSDASVHRIYIQTPVKMIRDPNIVVLNDTGIGNVTISGNVNSAQILSISSINVASISGIGVYIDMPLGSSNQIGYGQAVFNIPVVLDANDYS